MDLCTPKAGITKTNDLIFETSPIENETALLRCLYGGALNKGKDINPFSWLAPPQNQEWGIKTIHSNRSSSASNTLWLSPLKDIHIGVKTIFLFLYTHRCVLGKKWVNAYNLHSQNLFENVQSYINPHHCRNFEKSVRFKFS